jgi:tRNA nucleotidyltransferase (CCA-adding enzyme)
MQAITASDFRTFLEEKVNLKQDAVRAYREQVNHLRDRLEAHIKAHPDFDLLSLRHFGSLAKGTAVSTLREMDVAAYIKPAAVEGRARNSVLETIRDLLIGIYPQMAPSQFTVDPPAVTINFRSSELEVDVVPVIPNGKPDGRGLLALRNPEWVETSIPLHLDFIRKRSTKHSQFRELVRLTKWWRNEKEVPLSSFLIELIWCHLVDTISVSADHQEALLGFFAYVERTRLEMPIAFADNYRPSEIQPCRDLVKIFDPVNPSNNVGASVTRADRDIILRRAEEALDTVAAGSAAYSKGRGVESYQRVFGSAFNV